MQNLNASGAHNPAGRTIAIGDIHGCVHALDAVLNAICPTKDDLIISLGDFIDTGYETSDVIRTLLSLESTTRFKAILGNHEEMLLAALTSEKMKDSWIVCGGHYTLQSYRYCGDIKDIPEAHIDFIRRCIPYYETRHEILVHANYLPEVPLPEQPGHVLRWTPLVEPYPAPHVSGKRAIMGHTEQRSGEILNLGHLVCIDTCCHSYGWLTAMDLENGTLWQASRWGVLREDQVFDDLQRARKIISAKIPRL